MCGEQPFRARVREEELIEAPPVSTVESVTVVVEEAENGALLLPDRSTDSSSAFD
jgi:hypothetical protein